jgi:hypothetical protein
MDNAAKKQIMREAAVAPHLNNHAYSRIPTDQVFSSDIDRRVKHYAAHIPAQAHSHRLAAPTDTSRAYHQAEIQQLSDLLMYHTRHGWSDDVFSLADKSVSLQGIYRQSGHIMRSVSRNVTHSTVRDCVAYQFSRAVHWAAAQELERLIGAKSVSLSVGRDIGDLAINRCILSGHGIRVDNMPDTLIAEPELSDRPDLQRHSKVWLRDEEAAKHKILIRGGQLYFATHGQLVDTQDDSYRDHGAGPNPNMTGAFREPGLNSAGYVLSTNGDLYAGIHAPGTFLECMGKNPFFHSSYMGGGDVLCGGRIFVKEGVLVGIDNSSGHYQPTADHLRQCIRELERQGVSLRGLYCEDFSRTDRGDPFSLVMLWPSADDFLAGSGDGAPIKNTWLQANEARLQRTVTDYQKSRGFFSKTSTQTQDALNVLQAVQTNSTVFCVACVWYAFSPETMADDQRWLKNAKEFVEGKAQVRLEPLEVGLAGRLSTQKFKSGLRSKLREVMESRLIEIRGLYH